MGERVREALAAHRHWGAAVALVGLLWSALVFEISSHPPAHMDEPRWIATSHLTWELVTGFAGPERWERAYDERALGLWGNLNPPIGKLVIGAAVAPFVRPDDGLDYRWDLDLDAAGNAAAGNLPPQRLLVPARIAVSLCAAATLLLVYAAALQVTGARWLSLLAPVALFASVPFRFHAARAYTDVPQLALMVASLVCFARFAAGRGRAGLWGGAVALGLATAVKLSTAPLVPVAAAAAAFRRAAPAQRLRDAALAGLLPFAVFCAVNPYLWPDPVGRSLDTVSIWSKVYAIIQQDPRLAQDAVSSRPEALALVTERAVTAPQLWHPALDRLGQSAPQLLAVTAVGLLVTLRRRRVGLRGPLTEPRVAGLLALCTGVGAACLLLGMRLAPALLAFGLYTLAVAPVGVARERRAERWLLLGAFATTFAATVLWLPFDWDRYYLRLVTLASVCWAVGVVVLSRLVTLEPREPAAPG